jgi:hypothetical protein
VVGGRRSYRVLGLIGETIVSAGREFVEDVVEGGEGLPALEGAGGGEFGRDQVFEVG